MTVETSLVVQALPFAILVLDVSPEFVILHGSDEYLAATMTSRADVIGRPLFEAFPASSSDADGPDRLCASLHEVLRTRRLHTCLLYTSPSPRDRTRSRMPSSA